MTYRLRGTIEQVCNLLIFLSSIVLFFLMVLTVIDVVGRFFGIPVPGATGQIGAGLSVAIALALPAVNWRGGHIALGLFKGHQRSIWERLRRLLVALATVVAILALTYVMFLHATSAAEYEDVIGYLEIPLAPLIYIFAGMSALTAGVSILNLFGIYRQSPSENEIDGVH